MISWCKQSASITIHTSLGKLAYNRFMHKLKDIVKQIEGQKYPPVHLWHPKDIGEIDIKIDATGHWFHEGQAIERDKLVCLFASILWFEDGSHFLVTPVEKLKIVVEDVPFIIHQAEIIDGVWALVTNTHDQLLVGQSHTVELREYLGQWVPYVHVRYDLWARLNRSIYYEWVNQAMDSQENVEDRLLLSSGDYEFEVAR